MVHLLGLKSMNSTATAIIKRSRNRTNSKLLTLIVILSILAHCFSKPRLFNISEVNEIFASVDAELILDAIRSAKKAF